MSTEFSPPFRPSWFDRFLLWLEARPGPYWLTILIIYVLLSVQSQLTNWIAGIELWGQLNPEHLVYQLFTAEVLYFWKYLDRDARRALAAFRPMLSVEEKPFLELEYRFTHQPARHVAALTILGLVLGAYYSFSIEVMNSGSLSLSFATIYGILGFGVPMTLALIFVYRIIRQLRIVTQLYASASEIDLYHLNPVYALSSHTAKTGLILLMLIYTNLLLSPGSIEVPTALITTVAISLISVSAFLLPLQGINHRLVAEKKALVSEVNDRIKRTFTLLESKVDGRDWGQIKEVETAISGLERQKLFIERIPTWPWQPGTVRGFLSAMLLPILLWAIQQLLGRLLSA